MNKPSVFIGLSLLSVICIALLFVLVGKPYNSSSDNPTLSSSDESRFIADVKELDTLYLKLQKAAYLKDVKATAQVNIRWEKQKDAFLTRYTSNPVLAKLAAQVHNNYRQRVKVLKETYRMKAVTFSKAEQLKEAITSEEAQKEELKAENQMIKQALLTL
ncbi:hypothetical protein [Runella slithyformis]|uniref:Uncharacterized protein n=1 Tax=Runella slithyformis (strain ATCC 29530 / DSM 19594 / LMG 11500 / NCIMB 11436 / LSU 4) TaxID=761193 RepID=A0A7U3ZQJ4_RUNSL|nr:hypothetical protein [Runella slithyformis]AEI51525.1 hypothetical protein Runsl_5225 [Runella slithyformis DSM 19594]